MEFDFFQFVPRVLNTTVILMTIYKYRLYFIYTYLSHLKKICSPTYKFSWKEEKNYIE